MFFYLGIGVTIVARINTHHTFHKNKHFALCSQHLHLKLPYRVPAKTIAPQSIPSCPPNHQELISPHMCRYYENMKNLSITKLESTPLLYISTSTLHWFLPTLLRSCVLFSQLFRTFNAPKTISQMTWSEKITAPGIVREHFLHLDNSKPHIKGVFFYSFHKRDEFSSLIVVTGADMMMTWRWGVAIQSLDVGTSQALMFLASLSSSSYIIQGCLQSQVCRRCRDYEK